MILTLIFVNAVFLIIAFYINPKNAKYLLAGYNTMPEKERAKVNIEGLLNFIKFFLLKFRPTQQFCLFWFVFCSVRKPLPLCGIFHLLSFGHI